MLEASENLQVIEIGVPAEHITTVDHEMTLPTAVLESGARIRRTDVLPQRGGGGGVVAVAGPGVRGARDGHRRPPPRRRVRAGGSPGRRRDGQPTSHASDILFTFVLSGSVALHAGGHGVHTLARAMRS